MYDEEVRPYNLLSLLMEVDGLYRAPLYEKTLDEGTVQPRQFSPVSYSYIRFSFHLSFHRHVCSGFRLRLLRVVLRSENGDFAWVDYLALCSCCTYIAILQQCVHVHLEWVIEMRKPLRLYQLKALNTWWSKNSNTLNMHRKISRKQLFAWVLPTTNSSFFIHYAVWPIHYSSLAIVCNLMCMGELQNEFRSFQIQIILSTSNHTCI